MKHILLNFLLVTISLSAYAQPKIGLTLAPNVLLNRVKHSATDQITNYRSILRVSVGLEADFQITDVYAFSTGIIFASKQAAFKVSKGTTSTDKEIYKLQYLQIPLTLKLFTTEIQPDLKPFFQIGFLGEIKVYDEALELDYTLVDSFKFYDISFLGGVGVEYGAGVNTILFAGIFYSRGLVNIVESTTDANHSTLSTKMDMFSLKVGIKF